MQASEKRVVYVESIAAYQDQCRTSQNNWIFTHVELSAHAHNIVQEVHEWLLSGIEALDYIYFAALF